MPGLLEVLAPDVLIVGDRGGLAPTIPKPVRGAAKLAPVIARFAELAPGARAFIVDLNGGIAARIDPDGENDTAVSFVIEDGRITQIYQRARWWQWCATTRKTSTGRCSRP